MKWLQKVEHLYGNGVLGGFAPNRMHKGACDHKVRIWRRTGLVRDKKND